MRIAVSPDDVAMDHRCMFGVWAVNGVIKSEEPDHLKMCLDAIQLGRIRWCEGELVVVGGRQLADAGGAYLSRRGQVFTRPSHSKEPLMQANC